MSGHFTKLSIKRLNHILRQWKSKIKIYSYYNSVSRFLKNVAASLYQFKYLEIKWKPKKCHPKVCKQIAILCCFDIYWFFHHIYWWPIYLFIYLFIQGITGTSTVNLLKRKRRNAVADRRKIWHRKIIPYEIKGEF